jgi:hypothetical protein
MVPKYYHFLSADLPHSNFQMISLSKRLFLKTINLMHSYETESETKEPTYPTNTDIVNVWCILTFPPL